MSLFYTNRAFQMAGTTIPAFLVWALTQAFHADREVLEPILRHVTAYNTDLQRVRQNGGALGYVKEQTPELCMAAVQQDGLAIRFVKKQTPELCMVAVRHTGWALEYVKEQTPELCMAAFQKNGLNTEFLQLFQ